MFQRTYIHASFAMGVVAAAVLMATPVAASGDNGHYPTKPVRLIIPFPPGGGNDIVGRLVASPLSERLGQQIVVDNRGGGGGVIGSQLAANAQADGYTLLLISATYTVTPWLYKLPYDPVKAFAPISMIASSPNVLAVNSTLPAHSVRELINLAKAKPGQLNYASGGVGSNPHLSALLFNKLAGIDTVHVPFRGTGPMIVDVIGGQTQFCIGPLVAMLPQVKSGRLRALATTGHSRGEILPDLPTVSEAGVPGYESSNWWGVMAPALTPNEVVLELNRDISTVVSSKETVARLASEGAVAASMSPDEFRTYVLGELKKWERVIREFNVQPASGRK